MQKGKVLKNEENNQQNISRRKSTFDLENHKLLYNQGTFISAAHNGIKQNKNMNGIFKYIVNPYNIDTDICVHIFI